MVELREDWLCVSGFLEAFELAFYQSLVFSGEAEPPATCDVFPCLRCTCLGYSENMLECRFLIGSIFKFVVL